MMPTDVPEYRVHTKPSPGELPRLQTSANVTREPLQDGKELVTINVTFENTGSTRAGLHCGGTYSYIGEYAL